MVLTRSLFDEKMLERFEEIKGKYKGERAWCVGNGPSLASTPLELLENEYTFGLTNIAKIYPSTSWRPSFYVNVTHAVMEGGSYVAAAKAAIEGTPSFLCASFLPTLLEKAPDERYAYLLPRDVYPLRVTCREKQTSGDVSVWSNDIFERVSKDGSSMLTVMQIAAYMGFDPLILIGCDMGWKAFDWEENKDPNHFIDSYWDYRKRGDRKIEMTERYARNCSHDVLMAHRIAKQACDRLGIKVYNATIGGELEVFPRIDFMEAIREHTKGSTTFVGRIALHEQDINVLYEIASLGKTYVEIGTLFGGSACVAGMAGCEVFCIDPLDGYYSAKHDAALRPDRRTGLVATEEIVRGNWEHCGLDPEMLHIYKQLHPPWPTEIDREFDVGFIDGDHRIQDVLNDYTGMGPRVKYLVFHDIDKAGVRATYNMALESGDWDVYISKTKKPNIMGTLKRR